MVEPYPKKHVLTSLVDELPEPIEIIITKFSGHPPMVERADKFENGYKGGSADGD